MKIQIEFDFWRKHQMGKICRECAGLIDYVNNQDWTYHNLAETLERLRQEFLKLFPNAYDSDKDDVVTKGIKAVEALYGLGEDSSEWPERKRIASKQIESLLFLFQRYYNLHC